MILGADAGLLFSYALPVLNAWSVSFGITAVLTHVNIEYFTLALRKVPVKFGKKTCHNLEKVDNLNSWECYKNRQKRFKTVSKNIDFSNLSQNFGICVSCIRSLIIKKMANADKQAYCK